MNIGTLCVSVFFFLSAYGLIVSYKNKSDYLNHFLPSRFSKLLIPFVTAYIFSLVIYAIFKGGIDWANVWTTLAWGGPYMKFSWYVTEIAVVYFLFYFSFKIHFDGKLIILNGLIIAVIILLILLHQPYWYIVSLPAFMLGSFYATFEDDLLKLNQRAILTAGICLSIVLVVFLRWSDVSAVSGIQLLSKYRFTYLAYFVSNIVFVIAAAFLFSKILKLTPPRC